MGKLCDAMVAFSERNNGLLSRRISGSHHHLGRAISTDYRGYTIYELPPNGQGIVALEMLNVLEGYDIASLGHNSPEYLHLLTRQEGGL